MAKIKDKSLIERLNNLLDAKGVSKADLARIADVSPQAVNNWFTKGLIGREAATKIANHLQFSLDWLLNGGAGEPLNRPKIRQKRLQELLADKSIPSHESDLFEKLISGEVVFDDRIARRIERDYNIPEYFLDTVPDGFQEPPLSLNDQEKELLMYFQRFPQSEKVHMLALFREKADGFDVMFEELLKAREESKFK